MKVNLHTSKMQCFWSGFGIQIVNGKLSRNVKKAFEKGTRRGRPEAKAKRNAVPKFSIRWIRKRAHPWQNEEPSKRQCLKGDEMENQGAVPSQGVVPHESAVLSNGVVPSESAVLNAAPSESLELPSESAVPSGTAAVPPSSDVAAPASESGAPGASGNRITKHNMSPKEFFYSSMDAEIGSATLTFSLYQKGHRFGSTHTKTGYSLDQKDRYTYPLQMSKAFVNMPCKGALKEARTWAWDRWNLVKKQAEWKISDSRPKPQGAFLMISWKHFVCSQPCIPEPFCDCFRAVQPAWFKLPRVISHPASIRAVQTSGCRCMYKQVAVKSTRVHLCYSFLGAQDETMHTAMFRNSLFRARYAFRVAGQVV